MTATEIIAPQSRREEIEGWLNAYRHNWVIFDRAHVNELQAELAAITATGTVQEKDRG